MSYKGPIEDKSVAPTLIIPPELFRLKEVMRELQQALVTGGALGDLPQRVRASWESLNRTQRELARQGVQADFPLMCQALNDANALISRSVLAQDPLNRAKR